MACKNLIHDGQQLAESQTEPSEGITVFELQCESVLQLRHQDAFTIGAACLVPGGKYKIL